MLLRSPRTGEGVRRGGEAHDRSEEGRGERPRGGGRDGLAVGRPPGSRSLIRVLKLVDRTSLSFVDASRRGSSPLSDIFVLSRGNIIRDYLWGSRPRQVTTFTCCRLSAAYFYFFAAQPRV